MIARCTCPTENTINLVCVGARGMPGQGIIITYHNRYLAALTRAENCGDGIMLAALLDGALLHINKSSKQ